MSMAAGPMRWLALVAVVSLCCGGVPAAAGEPMALGFVETGQHILGFNAAASSRFAIADVDGDGISDFVFCATSGGSVLIVAGRLDDASIGFKQVYFLPGSGNIVRVLSANVAGASHIYAVADDGTVHDFTGWPLQESRTLNVAVGAMAAAVGDLLGDGQSDLLVLTGDHLYAYDLDTGAELWSYAVSGAYDLVLAQLDDDPASEIVLNTTPGMVLDGATRMIDWQYIDGFGYPLAAGHLLGDATIQFIGTSGYSEFTVFRGAPWSPLWSGGDAFGGISALATAKIDDSGSDVILEGDAQWGAVHVIDAGTHQERFQIPNPGWGVNAIAVLDIDGDAVPDIVFAATASYGEASMEVVDSVSGEVKWSFTPQTGVFAPVALGDVDGDGQEELVVAGNNANDFGPIEIYDEATGALEWQSPLSIGNANDPFYISTSRVLLSPHSADQAEDIILAGTSIYDGRITVFDGVTHNVKLQIGTYASGPMQSRYLIDAALVDYDGDGVLDIVAATSPSSTGSSGAELQVFSGANGQELWTSVPMGSGFSGIVGVLVTGPATDPSSELIAVLPGSLRAYNIQTGLLDWTLVATADGATYIPDGVSGPEMAVFQHSGAVTFYDVATQAYLRSFTLPSPVNALLPLEGNASKLLAAGANSLWLVDGTTGERLARTGYLGEGLGMGNQLAETYQGQTVWHVASGSSFGAFRHEIKMVPDTVFANGFESQKRYQVHLRPAG